MNAKKLQPIRAASVPLNDAAKTASAFPSLDFPGRTTLMLSEMATKLGVSVRHLLNEVDEGVLTVMDLKGNTSSRSCWRIPVESYREYVLQRVFGPSRAEFLAALPVNLRKRLIAELYASLEGEKP